MLKLKSATMFYNDKEIELKEVDTESCVQLYFEILGSKFELDYSKIDFEDIANAIDLQYNYVDNKFTLVNYEYKLVFEVEVEIDGVHNYEDFVIEAKNLDGIAVLKSSLLGEINENLEEDGFEGMYKQLEPNVHMQIGNCFQI